MFSLLSQIEGYLYLNVGLHKYRCCDKTEEACREIKGVAIMLVFTENANVFNLA